MVPAGTPVAPILATVGLVLIGLVTLALFTGSVPFRPAAGSATARERATAASSGRHRTPTPSNVVIVAPQTDVPGTLVFVKQGNLWTQTGNKAVQITTSGGDSMPSWSPDGAWIYYIESVHDAGLLAGRRRRSQPLHLDYPGPDPDPGRRRPEPEKLLSGRYQAGLLHVVLLDPPAADVAGRRGPWRSSRDGPDPTKSDVVLQTYDVTTKKTQADRAGREPAARPPGSGLAPDGK